MRTAELVVDPAFRHAELDRRVFGTFVEHLGRCVYGGVYEPGHPQADDTGLRGDVLALTRELGPTVVRYPGGNFVSGYRWEDGIGPVAQRPRRLDLAWTTIEPNTFGLDEFMRWIRKVGADPMLAVNLGTRGVTEACELLEYCNHPGGTRLSDLRRAHGVSQPYDIKLWCLGNEMDGPWQIGHKTAEEYARLAAETARAMRMLDPDIELVACGSSNSTMPTFASWEATVLEHTYELVDYLSLHHYYELAPADDLPSFLASAVGMDRYIEAVAATADHVGAKLGSRRTLRLSFDEWNVWFPTRRAERSTGHRRDWTDPPPDGEDYGALDAVVVGGLLISLLRHADRVGIACQAQLVNVLAPISTRSGGPAWRQSIFHPFALTAANALPTVLHTALRCPTHHTAQHGEVTDLDAVATTDPATGELALFIVNRADEPVALTVDVPRVDRPMRVHHSALHDTQPFASNTAEDQYRVTPRRSTPVPMAGRRHTVELPAASWHTLRLVPHGASG